MLAFVTICDMVRVGIVIDLETGSCIDVPIRSEFIDRSITGRPPCRPFGISWSDDELFVANNKQLLVFGRDFAYRRTEPIALPVNTHQLAFHNGVVWAASPWTNSLIGHAIAADVAPVEFKPLSQEMLPYVARDTLESDDVYHINSLLWADHELFVVAHNLGKPSFILGFDPGMRLKQMRYEIGAAVHGVALVDDELFWLSTKTHEVRSSMGYVFPIRPEAFSRGLAVTKDYLIVATSEFKTRNDRVNGDSWVTVIERWNKRIAAQYRLSGTGSINDLRVLDEYDYAHHVAPFCETITVPRDLALQHTAADHRIARAPGQQSW